MVYNSNGLEIYDLKLIDMGSTTFDFNYLIAKTP